ncbi:putative phage tail protein [Paenibacillus humicus]|uniref:putative phage tail protein n=1 Tax=Paenibacillus humicus TaxID=412861 RepID=UPI000FD87662|nr:putative phage tail protein [Paenibacillus humicus]
MAVVNIGAIVTSAAILSGKVTLVARTGSAIASTAAVTGAVIRILSAKGGAASRAVTGANTVLLRYTSASTASKSAATVRDVKQYKTLTAAISAKATVEAYRYDRDISRDVSEYLPKFYEDFRVVLEMMARTANESTRLHALVQRTLDDMYPDTASEAGIERWERDYGITPMVGATLVQRKAAVIARMKAPGVTTLGRFTALVNEFYGSNVAEDFKAGRVETTIITKRGEPENIAEMRAAVYEVLPAHIAHEFVYTYLPWKEVQDTGLTWDGVHKFANWGEFQTAFLI